MEQIEKVVGQLKIHHGEIEGLLKRVKNLEAHLFVLIMTATDTGNLEKVKELAEALNVDFNHAMKSALECDEIPDSVVRAVSVSLMEGAEIETIMQEFETCGERANQ